jgi:hypothetical protein
MKILECGRTCALADRIRTRRIRLSYAGQPGEKPASQPANLAANINDIVEQYQHTIWPDMGLNARWQPDHRAQAPSADVSTLAPDGTETVLYSFTGGADGNLPMSGLLMDSNGNLYGVTEVKGCYR